MTELKDTVQVGLANSSAIAFSITDCNEVLTLVSLILAITFTVYKFLKYEKDNV
tara:strand:+ start:1536 stop:1697 length:162 start_codon:yes stop_codon:yes gene_type:complete